MRAQLTRHLAHRFSQRHEREVQVRGLKGAKGLCEMQKELARALAWEAEDGTLLLVYQKLRVYVARREGEMLVVLTEYPYTSSVRRRLFRMERTSNPLRAEA